MSKRGYGSGFRRLATTLGLAAAGILALAPLALAADPPGKLKKQIEVMEKILDQVLVDSRNVLVGSHNATNGVYLEEFGVIFAIEASLLPMGHGGFDWDWSKFKMNREGGKWRIEFDDDDSTNGKSQADKDKDDEDDDEDAPVKSDAELYQGAKDELRTALLDYGETLAGLRDTQWVAVAVFLDDDDFFKKRDTNTLVLKAKMADLRAFGADRLSKKDMESRLIVEEY